jgi:hypothetical protein
VHTPEAALQQQFDASMQTYQEAMATSAALGQARELEKGIAAREPSAKLTSYRKQLEELSGPETTSRRARLTPQGPATLASVGGSLQMLMGRMQGADRAPTAADIEALGKISSEYRQLMSRWEKLKGQPFAERNPSLRGPSQPSLVSARGTS